MDATTTAAPDPLTISVDELVDEVSRDHARTLVDLATARIALRKRDERLAAVSAELAAAQERVGQLAGQLANTALRAPAPASG